MTGPAIRGRCPSLMAPMASGDGLLVRVKPRAATLAAGQAEAVAAAAARHGNGIVEPTNRGHLQVRGLSADGAGAFAGRMAQIGLAAGHPRGEAVRNVLADPLGPDDPAAHFDSHDLARRLGAMLESSVAWHDLPDKFGLLVDAGEALPLAGCRADIAIRSGAGGAVLALDGGDCRLGIPVGQVEDAVRRLLTAFLSWLRARGGTEAPARMKAMVAECGAGAVFRAAGLDGAWQKGAAVGEAAAAGRPPIGFVPVAGAARGCFLMGAPFGGLDAPVLAALAGLSRRFGDATIRVAPWKSFVLCGVSPAAAGTLRDAAAEAGLVADPADPRRRIVACAGRPRCAGALADTRADAAYFAPVLAAQAVPAPGLLHISGCAKGCAHPAAADIALVAAPGGYDLVRGGRAGDPPVRTGLSRQAAAAALAGGGTAR